MRPLPSRKGRWSCPRSSSPGLAARSGWGFGLFWLAPWLTFSVLMATSIVAAMLLMLGYGFPDAVAPLVMVAVVLSVSAVAL